MSLLLTFLLSFAIVGIAVAGMAVGVMAGRSPLRGSCGGVAGKGCELCSGRCRKRREADTGRG